MLHDETTIRGTSTLVLSTRSRKQMKKHVARVVPKPICIYTVGKGLTLRAGPARPLPHPSAAAPPPKSSAVTHRRPRKVIMTPAKHAVSRPTPPKRPPPFSLWSSVPALIPPRASSSRPALGSESGPPALPLRNTQWPRARLLNLRSMSRPRPKWRGCRHRFPSLALRRLFPRPGRFCRGRSPPPTSAARPRGPEATLVDCPRAPPASCDVGRDSHPDSSAERPRSR